MVPVYVGLGVAGVGLVSAIVFAAFKADANSKAEANAAEIRKGAERGTLPPQEPATAPPRRLRPRAPATRFGKIRRQVNTNATVANVSLGRDGSRPAFSLAWYLLAPKTDDQPTRDPTAPDAHALRRLAVGWPVAQRRASELVTASYSRSGSRA